MKKYLSFVFLLLIAIFALSADDYNVQTSTTFPENGVFEIITSSLKMQNTFMLNKITGDTWQLVKRDYNYYWIPLTRTASKTKGEAPKKDVPVFQITMSGIAAKGTYLTNTASGETWMLYEDSDTGSLYWKSIELIK